MTFDMIWHDEGYGHLKLNDIEAAGIIKKAVAQFQLDGEARLMASEYFDTPCDELTQQMIRHYLRYDVDYDAVEVSHIVGELHRRGL